MAEIKRRKDVSSDNTCLNVSVAQLVLEKQRYLCVNSFADKQDKERLLDIRKEKQLIRENAKIISKKQALIVYSSTKCGFDFRLILSDTVWKQNDIQTDPNTCQRVDCKQHEQWQDLIILELEQEKREQFDIAIGLEREKNQIKNRMIKRRSEVYLLSDNIYNCAIEHTTAGGDTL